MKISYFCKVWHLKCKVSTNTQRSQQLDCIVSNFLLNFLKMTILNTYNVYLKKWFQMKHAKKLEKKFSEKFNKILFSLTKINLSAIKPWFEKGM